MVSALMSNKQQTPFHLQEWVLKLRKVPGGNVLVQARGSPLTPQHLWEIVDCKCHTPITLVPKKQRQEDP